MNHDSLFSDAQREYISAQAQSRVAKAVIDAREKKFCERHNLVNPITGKAISHIWMMCWDRPRFEVLNEQFCTENADACRFDVESQNRFREAEKALIEWGISILPENLRKVFSGGIMSQAVRKRFIEITMSIDPTTIPSLS